MARIARAARARWLAVVLLTTSRRAAALNNGLGLRPAMGFSTWNHFQGAIGDVLLREVADAMVASGLRQAGYEYLNLDDGWAVGRTANGTIIPDPALFPNGMKAVVDYVHSKNIKFGIYTARGSTTCMGRPGSDSHEQQDADTYAQWGVDYLKEDSCGGTTHGTVWEQYLVMRDALNRTGRPIYFSITQGVPWTDGHERMHCYGDSAFTVLEWLSEGLDPTQLANSYLVEYCNNEDMFGYTDGTPQPGGFLSNLDSQQLLTLDNLTVVGAYNDNDMLEVCNGGQTSAEYRSQFSTWAILSSPLILGNDPRAMDADCLAIVLNAEVIAVSQDARVARGALVYQWPAAAWPNNTAAATRPRLQRPQGRRGAAAAPFPLAALRMAPCDGADPAQAFAFNATDGTLRHAHDGTCLTYGGYEEANFKVTACASPPWSEPGIGSQRWTVDGAALRVDDNPGKVADVLDCDLAAAGSVQVCTQGGADCYSTPLPGPPGCGLLGQAWRLDASGATTSIASAAGNFSHCVSVTPLPPPPVDIRLQVWAKPLADGSVAAVLFNRSPAPLPANLTWAMLGVKEDAPLRLRDLWAHADLGVFTGRFTALVQPHDVVMVRAAPA